MAEAKKGRPTEDDGHRKYKMTGGGPLDGVVARIYPDPTREKKSARRTWQFNNLDFPDGTYLLGPVPEKKKVGTGHWKGKP